MITGLNKAAALEAFVQEVIKAQMASYEGIRAPVIVCSIARHCRDTVGTRESDRLTEQEVVDSLQLSLLPCVGSELVLNMSRSEGALQ